MFPSLAEASPVQLQRIKTLNIYDVSCFDVSLCDVLKLKVQFCTIMTGLICGDICKEMSVNIY